MKADKWQIHREPPTDNLGDAEDFFFGIMGLPGKIWRFSINFLSVILTVIGLQINQLLNRHPEK